MNEPICSFEKCFTCHCSNCDTGRVARVLGREAYEKVLKELEEAEVYSSEE